MSIFLDRIALGAALVLATTFNAGKCAAAAQDDGTRLISSRTLPVPNDVSPALQKLLQRDYKWPLPKTIGEWRQFAAGPLTEDAQRAEQNELARLTNRFGVTVAPHTIGGVPCYVVTPPMVKPRNRKRRFSTNYLDQRHSRSFSLKRGSGAH